MFNAYFIMYVSILAYANIHQRILIFINIIIDAYSNILNSIFKIGHSHVNTNIHKLCLVCVDQHIWYLIVAINELQLCGCWLIILIYDRQVTNYASQPITQYFVIFFNKIKKAVRW